MTNKTKAQKIKGPTTTERWDQGIDHDPRSLAILEGMRAVEDAEGGDCGMLDCGGDGDPGETLMFLMDVYFYNLDRWKRESR